MPLGITAASSLDSLPPVSVTYWPGKYIIARAACGEGLVKVVRWEIGMVNPEDIKLYKAGTLGKHLLLPISGWSSLFVRHLR